jgi:membrane protein DedA with SNARE-associated domain
MEHFIVRTLVDYGYIAVFVLMMLQGMGIPIPSEVTMALGGAAASSTFVASVLGADAQPISLALVIVAGVAGDLVGSSIAYTIGRLGGRPLVRRWGARIFRREHEVERAERWFERHGERAVFVCKMIPLARSYISFPAGVAEMPPVRFGAFVVLGSLPFSTAMALLGYAFGDSVLRYLRAIALVAAVVLAALAVWWFVRHRGQESSPRTQPDHDQEQGQEQGQEQEPADAAT